MNNADITLGDFWGVGTRRLDLDDDHGTSLVLINSQKGLDIFEDISDNLHFSECDLDHAIAGNPRLESSPKPSWERTSFFRALDAIPFDSLIRKYINKSLLQRVSRKLMKIILGLINNFRPNQGESE